MDSSMLQINAPASIQCLPVHAASTATNNLYKAKTPLSVFVTQSDVHSMHLSPVPLSLPRPSLQAIKSTRRHQQWSPARDCGVSVVRQQVVSRQREPQSKRLRAPALPCHSVNDSNVNAKPSQAEKACVCVCVCNVHSARFATSP